MEEARMGFGGQLGGRCVTLTALASVCVGRVRLRFAADVEFVFQLVHGAHFGGWKGCLSLALCIISMAYAEFGRGRIGKGFVRGGYLAYVVRHRGCSLVSMWVRGVLK